jgi:hypothetical protein
MLYREIIAVCSQIHTKHTNTLCEQNVELLYVKLAALILGLIRLKPQQNKFCQTTLLMQIAAQRHCPSSKAAVLANETSEFQNGLFL